MLIRILPGLYVAHDQIAEISATKQDYRIEIRLKNETVHSYIAKGDRFIEIERIAETVNRANAERPD